MTRTLTRRRLGAAALAAAAMLLAACGSSGNSVVGGGAGSGQNAASSSGSATNTKGTLAIGVLAPFTGATANFGQAFAEGARAAATEINNAGGVLGKKISIVQGDTVGDPIDAVPALQKMIAFNHIVALVGPQTPEMPAVQPVIDRQHIPDMFQGGSADYDHLTDPWVWRASPSDSQLGVAMALYAIHKGYKRAAFVFSTEPSAQTLEPIVVATFKHLGGTAASVVTVALDQSSYRSEVANVVASHPQVIFTSTDGVTAGALFNDFRQANNLAVPFIGSDSTTGSDYVKAVGASTAHKVLVSVVGGSEPGGGGSVFTAQYAKLFSHQPLANANYAYDSVIDLALAIVKAGSTSPSAIVGALPSVSNPPGQTVTSYSAALAALKAGQKINYDGASGPMDYNSYHNVFGPFDAVQVDSSGNPHTLLTFSAAQLQKATG